MRDLTIGEKNYVMDEYIRRLDDAYLAGTVVQNTTDMILDGYYKYQGKIVKYKKEYYVFFVCDEFGHGYKVHNYNEKRIKLLSKRRV